MKQSDSDKSFNQKKIKEFSADEQFSIIMQCRLQPIQEKACCDSHASSPMYVDGIRLACCAGSGSSCKIKELQFLMGERKRLGDLNDRYQAEHSQMAAKLREANLRLKQSEKEVADLQEQNNQLEYKLNCKRARETRDGCFETEFKGWSNTFPTVPYEPFPHAQKAPKVVHYHNTTNVMNINFVGSETIRKHGVKLLLDACKPDGNLLKAVTSLLESDLSPENKKLLQLKAADPKAFQQAVIENVKPAVADVPEEFRDKIDRGLNAASAKASSSQP